MRGVDFRPNWYCVSRNRKRNTAIRVLLLSILAAEVILGSMGTFAQRAAARQQVAELHGELQGQADVFGEIDELSSEVEGLRQEQELLSDVSGGVPAHRVLSEVSRLMPGTVVLTDLHLTKRRSIRKSGSTVGVGLESTEGIDADGPSGLEIMGWAASDVAVGTFMSNLAESAVFYDVSLSHSSPVIVRDRAARGFKLTCKLVEFE